MGSLVAAYTVAWSVLMIYVFTLAKRQRRLHQRLDQLQSEQQTGENPKANVHVQ